MLRIPGSVDKARPFLLLTSARRGIPAVHSLLQVSVRVIFVFAQEHFDTHV